MGKCVCGNALIACSFGAAPVPLTVTPQNKVVTSAPIATIMDNKPIANIPPFGMCSAPTNPAVIAATAAKAGVFSPAPCVPSTALPWAPGSPTVLIGNVPALNNSSKLICLWAGVIQVNFPGQVTIDVP